MDQVTQNILVIFSIVIISYLAKKAKLLPSSTKKVLTDLLFNITLPALIFTSVVSGPGLEILREAAGLVGVAIVYFLVSGLTALGILRKLKNKGKKAGVLAFAAIFSNTSFIGLPLILLLYGQAGVVLGAIYDLVQTLFMFTIGIMFMGAKKGRLLDTLLAQLKEPPVLALLVGLVVLVLDLRVPAMILEPLTMLGATTSAMAMFAIGQYLELRGFRELKNLGALLPVIGLKLLIIPIAVLGLVSFLPFTGLVGGVLAVMLASPTGVLTAVLAERYNQDERFAAMTIVATTALSVLTLPLILSFLS